MFLSKTAGLVVLLSIIIISLCFLNLSSFETLNQLPKFKLVIGDFKAKPISYSTDVPSRNKIYFVGDVMLGRHVETLMKRYGQEYPYQGLKSFNFKEDYLIGNFEGSVPVSHEKTKNNTLRFSVDNKYLAELQNFGFTHLSLANNHSYDFGKIGFLNTKIQLERYNLKSFGHPVSLNSSVEYLYVEEHKVAIIGINSTFSKPDKTELKNLMIEAKNNSDLQIVFIHWGDEYVQKPNEQQRKLAKNLIASGVDLIIGHHPHVVQSIEKVDGKLVFYSLGNFIFDQYFSDQVKEGLILKLAFEQTKPMLEIIPIDTAENLSQPKEMSKNKKTIFLRNLVNLSDPVLKSQIEKGIINLDENLATL